MEGPHSGRRVGAYVLQGELGRGGMGVVFKAWDPRAQRPVAIKKLLAHADVEELRRFEREARVTAELKHPGIAQVYEVVETGPGAPYLVLEFVEGRPLNAIAGKGLRLGHAAGLVAQVARAVSAAHDAGVLHRDLKPHNVIVRPDGTPAVVDFGLAKRYHDRSSLTGSGQSLGTPAYMAPEQVQDARSVGPAADVYGLGAVLFHCVTGSPPFEGASVLNVFAAILETEARSPRTLNPKVDAQLEAICLRCLRKDPAERYPSAGALAEALEAYLKAPARPAPQPKSRAPVFVAAALAVAVLGAGIVWLAQGSPEDPPPVDGPTEPPEDPAVPDGPSDPTDPPSDPIADVPAPEPTAEEAVATMLERRSAGDLPGALQACLQALAVDPRSPRTKDARELLLELEEKTWTERSGLERFGLAADHPLLLARRGRAQPAELERAVTSALGSAPTVTESLVAAAIFEEAKLYDRAGERLRAAQRAEPSSRVAMEAFYRYETSGKQIPAKDWLLPWLRELYDKGRSDPSHPGHDWAVFREGVQAHYDRDPDVAISPFTRIVERYPSFPGGYRGLGIAYLSLQRYREAVVAYTHALALDPRVARAALDRSSARLEAQDPEGELRDLQRSTVHDPGQPRVWQRLAGLHAERKEWGKSEEAANHAVKLDPGLAMAWLYRGQARGISGRLELARDDFTQAIEREPRLARAWLGRAQTREDLGDVQGAIEDYRAGMGVATPAQAVWLRQHIVRLGGDPGPPLPLSGAEMDAIQRLLGGWGAKVVTFRAEGKGAFLSIEVPGQDLSAAARVTQGVAALPELKGRAVEQGAVNTQTNPSRMTIDLRIGPR